MKKSYIILKKQLEIFWKDDLPKRMIFSFSCGRNTIMLQGVGIEIEINSLSGRSSF